MFGVKLVGSEISWVKLIKVGEYFFNFSSLRGRIAVSPPKLRVTIKIANEKRSKRILTFDIRIKVLKIIDKILKFWVGVMDGRSPIENSEKNLFAPKF